MTIFASAATGNVNAGGTWVGGVAPSLAGTDQIDVLNGHVVTINVDSQFGNNVTASGVGVRVRSGGRLIIASGAMLDARGTNKGTTVGTSNAAIFVENGGTLEHRGGGTLRVTCATDDQSGVVCQGVYTTRNAGGTLQAGAGNLALCDNAPANYSWSAAGSSTQLASNTNTPFDPLANQRAVLIGRWIANAAGTAMGSFGDSSIAWSGTNASLFTTEVSTIAAVNTAGRYYVDYEIGLVVFNGTTGGVGVTATFKQLAVTASWTFDFSSTAAGCQALFEYTALRYLGTTAAARFAINAKGKQSATVGANKLFKFDHGDVRFSQRCIQLDTCTGAAADPLLITNNYFGQGPLSSDAYGAVICAYNASNSYVQISDNTLNCADFFKTNTVSGNSTQTGFEIARNTGRVVQMVYNSVPPSAGTTFTNTFPGTKIHDNTPDGCGKCGAGNFLVMVEGNAATTAGRVQIYNNAPKRLMRFANFGSYAIYSNNAPTFYFHHGWIAGASTTTYYITDVWFTNNVTPAGQAADTPFVQFGYNNQVWLDGVYVVNNTTNGPMIEVGDSADGQGCSIVTNAYIVNNASVNATISASGTAYRRGTPDTVLWRGRASLTRFDHNASYNAGADYTGLSHQAVALRSGVSYNEDATRGVLGCAIYDPTYSSAPAAKALAYTYTSASNCTLAWDGGTAQQLVWDSGTATSATAATLVDTAKTWATGNTLNNDTPGTGNPRAKFAVITGGTGAGQVRAIVAAGTATSLSVTPKWTTTPDATSTYAILYADVQLTALDGTNKIRVGIDPRVLPSASATDSGITFAYAEIFTNPLFPVGTGQSVDPAQMIPPSGSPLATAGVALSGITPTSDYLGATRSGSTPTIGAYEIVSASPLVAGTLSAGTPTQTSAVLDWGPPSGGTLPYTVTVEYGVGASPSTWTTFSTASTGTAQVLSPLTAGTLYTIRKRVTDGASGSASVTASVTTIAALLAPTMNAAANVTISAADLSWPAATGGTPGYTYQVALSNDGGANWVNTGPSTGSLALTVSVNSGQTYLARVLVTDAASATDTSAAISFTTPLPIVTSVVVSPATASVPFGTTQQLTVVVTGTGSPATTVTWDTTDLTVFTVSATGLVTPTGVGTAQAIAMSTVTPSAAGSSTITVTASSAGLLVFGIDRRRRAVNVIAHLC